MLVAARFNEISQYCFLCLVSNVNLKLFRGVTEGFLEKVDLRTPPIKLAFKSPFGNDDDNDGDDDEDNEKREW